jgi:hypothetical protein
VEYIYFMIGLSLQGKVVNLKAQGSRGGMTMEEYISTHRVADTYKVGSQILSKQLRT